METKTNRYILLLTPSWLSALLTGFASVALLCLVYIYSQSSRGLISEILRGVTEIFQPLFQMALDTLAQNSLISNLPLLIFWSAVGAIVYVFGSQLFTALSSSVAIERTFFYANIEQDKLLKSLVISFGLRLAAFFVWLVYVLYFVKTLFPYVVSVIQEASYQSLISSLALLAFGLVLTAVLLHVHVVLFRVIALRARIFGSS